ncbi:MAG: hypothetical protein QM681_15895 [Novosphingobium sp.]
MYKAIFRIIRIYWSEYGGWKSLLLSPFWHFSIFAMILFHFGLIDLDWRALSISSLPTILGFSLAAYTITFSLMGSALHRALCATIDNERGIPLINIVNSTFFHVVLVQAIALIFSIASKGTGLYKVLRYFDVSTPSLKIIMSISETISNDFGFVFTIYSLVLLFSVAIAMYRLGRLAPSIDRKKSNPPASNDDSGSIVQENDRVLKSKRFKFVSWVAKVLRIYN